jgi:hypothetical protein
MTNIQKSNKTSGVINPVVAAVAGAVVGGVAVASAIIMSNKDNQDKVNEVVSNVKDDINNKKAVVIDKANKLEDIAKNTVNKVKNI